MKRQSFVMILNLMKDAVQKRVRIVKEKHVFPLFNGQFKTLNLSNMYVELRLLRTIHCDHISWKTTLPLLLIHDVNSNSI